MSKKVLALLMAVVMVAACVIFAAPEAKATDPHDNTHCICGGDAVGAAGHECGEANWQAWPAGEVPTAGYYYLTSDIVLAAQAVEGTTDTAGIVLTDDLYICLNGYNISSAANKVFTTVVSNQTSEEHVDLVICDCDTTGSVTNTSEATGIYGPIAGVQSITQFLDITIFDGNYSSPKTTAVDGGLFFVKASGSSTNPNTLDPKIKIYGGTFHDAKAAKGGLVYVQGHSELHIYGGTFYNGYGDTYGGLVCGWGGQSEVFIYNGTFYNGSTGTGATAQGGLVVAAGAMKIYNGTFYNGKAVLGGLVSAQHNLTISGGVFHDGEASEGGLVYKSGSSRTFRLSGGTFYNGTATLNGGNICNTNAIMNDFTGANIYGGTAPTGSNIYAKDGGGVKVVGVDPATVYGVAHIISKPILDAGLAGLGIMVYSNEAEASDFRIARFSLEGNDDSYDIVLMELDLDTFEPKFDQCADGAVTIWLANLLTADRAHGNEKLTVEIITDLEGTETVQVSYTTSMSELIAAAAQLEGLTALQSAALAAMQAMLPAAN